MSGDPTAAQHVLSIPELLLLVFLETDNPGAFGRTNRTWRQVARDPVNLTKHFERRYYPFEIMNELLRRPSVFLKIPTLVEVRAIDWRAGTISRSLFGRIFCLRRSRFLCICGPTSDVRDSRCSRLPNLLRRLQPSSISAERAKVVFSGAHFRSRLSRKTAQDLCCHIPPPYSGLTPDCSGAAGIYEVSRCLHSDTAKSDWLQAFYRRPTLA